VNRIYKFRKEMGITQKKLSSLSGVSHIQIGRYENGNVNPSINVLEKLAKALDVSLDELQGTIKINDDVIEAKISRLKEVLDSEEDKSAFCKLIDSFYLLCSNKKGIEELV
jgi:transcriptional regulator with XRE-family HTH domain